MKEEQNKAVVRRFIEERWNQRKLDTADELIAEDCVTHQLRALEESGGAPRSPELVKREAAGWLAAFPDLTFELEQMIAADDQVVSRYMIHGTHTGAWCGVSPTGRTIAVPMMTIHRIYHGKIVEDWVLVGTLTLLQQLGLVPETSEIIAAA